MAIATTGSSTQQSTASTCAQGGSPPGSPEPENAQPFKVQAYSWTEPEKPLEPTQHFSHILLLSGDRVATALEVLIFGSGIAAGLSGCFDHAGSMPLLHVAVGLLLKQYFGRVYNTYLEACYFSFPRLRTQPPKEQLLFRAKKDLMGRDAKQLDIMVVHDRLTLISSLGFEFLLFFAVRGFWPSPEAPVGPWYARLLSFFANHYLMSFGMYWSHRALHVVPFLWDKIHSYHHFARHPLSRNTYQDHWLDNFGNQIIGQTCAQIIFPLDYKVFWFSRFIRVAESLEKHSGISCGLNLAHSVQKWLPGAQMPHHHDWHHEGHKGSNYTFAPMGGVWDCLFATRKNGRALERFPDQATPHDVRRRKADTCRGSGGRWNAFPPVLLPIFVVLFFAAAKLKKCGGDITLLPAPLPMLAMPSLVALCAGAKLYASGGKFGSVD